MQFALELGIFGGVVLVCMGVFAGIAIGLARLTLALTIAAIDHAAGHCRRVNPGQAAAWICVVVLGFFAVWMMLGAATAGVEFYRTVQNHHGLKD